MQVTGGLPESSDMHVVKTSFVVSFYWHGIRQKRALHPPPPPHPPPSRSPIPFPSSQVLSMRYDSVTNFAKDCYILFSGPSFFFFSFFVNKDK